MHLILILSILLRVAGIVYSIVLWRRLRDWRIGTLTAILVLLSGRQIFTLINEIGHSHQSVWGHASEIPPLFISFLTLLALFLFGRMLTEKQRAVDALKISEHKFSKAFRYTPDSITIFRLDDGTVVDVNEGFERITGFSREEAIGRSTADLGIWNDRQDRRSFMDMIQRDGRVRDFESTMRTRSGKVIAFQASSESFNLNGRAHVVSVARDISQSRQRQRELIEAIEGEQRRIGHDLHDSLAQELVSVALQLQLVVNDARQQNSSRSSPLERINESLRQVIENTRRMAQGLSPVDLEQGGLPTALRRLAENISSLYRLKCDFSCDPRFPVLHGAAALQLYRIAQEAANNALRHSRCDRLSIDLASGTETLVLTVDDNGIGIGIGDQTDIAGMGRSIMDYRAKALGGKVVHVSGPAGGTRVRCVIPTAQATARESHHDAGERTRSA